MKWKGEGLSPFFSFGGPAASFRTKRLLYAFPSYDQAILTARVDPDLLSLKLNHFPIFFDCSNSLTQYPICVYL